ncbi:hypothetical protein [Pedobacter miscanthi]|uniref:Uncharacterized protein n=1 Tax=Pedobacter miscanthi TaxID=2259170 RepID=A0A366LDY1_9SPHI|nr:hypothetical protein [Pedobacter miscanthi]RBQ12071.1 hypothetical protein DRW42_02090 [Pedobacter miscanthi]
MNYELTTYRQLFDKAIKNTGAAEIDIEYLGSEITQESQRILNTLLVTTAQMEPSKIQQYIQQHQLAIHIILEETDTAKLKKNVDKMEESKHIIETFESSSEILLYEFQKYFPAYFNHQSMLPPALLRSAKAQIQQKSSQLLNVFTSRKKPNQPMNGLEEILSGIFNSHKSMNYTQKAYMEFFLDTLSEVLEKIEAGIELLEIILAIISLNYNHPLFYDFCCRYFRSEVDRCEELSSQVTTLNFIKKSISQTSPLTGGTYNPALPEIQVSLLKFITSELDYLNSMDGIGAHLYQHGLLDEHYKVTLTVKQLAIFIHLQVEANIIIAPSPKLLHEYIAKHYRTNETDRISAKSFKNAYYSASTEDLEKVIDKIVTMLSLAQEKL